MTRQPGGRLWTWMTCLMIVLAGCSPAPGASPAGGPTPSVDQGDGSTPSGDQGHGPTPPPAAGIRVVHTPGTLVDDMHLKPGQCHARNTTPAATLPDLACTPGAIDPALTKDVICTKGWSTKSVRPPVSVTDPAKRQSMLTYGTSGSASSFEYDHLIPLELGGASTTSNLWPQAGGSPNPKDVIESKLRAKVCVAGTLSLADAQREIVANWTTAR